MVFSIMTEFAGTVTEAKAFAKENSFNVPRRPGLSPNGLPFISLSGKRVGEIDAALAKFAELGWDRSSVILNKYGKHKAGRG